MDAGGEALDGEDRDTDETHSDAEMEGEAGLITASSKKRKINRKGLAILSNGTVSMRDLALAAQVPTKVRDEGTDELFKAKPTLSKAFTLFTLIVHGKNLPVEKLETKPIVSSTCIQQHRTA